MVFKPMARAVLMRCLQYSLGMRWGCISAPRIWNGFPFSMNSWFPSPPNLNTAGAPPEGAGFCTFRTAPGPAHANAPTPAAIRAAAQLKPYCFIMLNC